MFNKLLTVETVNALLPTWKLVVISDILGKLKFVNNGQLVIPKVFTELKLVKSMEVKPSLF